MASLKGQRRKQVTASRKKHPNGSIWLSYSEKQKADLVLLGDLEVIHWVSELEVEPKVRTFKHDEDVEVSFTEATNETFSAVRVIRVERTDGSVELHQLDASENSTFENVGDPVRYRSKEEGVREATLVRVSAARLKAFSKSSLGFWLRVIASVSQVRGYDLNQELGIVGTAVILRREGTIGSLLASLEITDTAIAEGAVCRSILQGIISVDAEPSGFGNNTRWRLA